MLPFHGLPVSCVHCAQTAKDIVNFFAYDSLVSLPDRVKIWLSSVDFFLPKFCTKATDHPVDLSIGDIRWQIAAEWLDELEIAQWSQWRAYRKLPSLFRMVPSLTPYDLPFPKIGVLLCCLLPNYFGPHSPTSTTTCSPRI